MGRAGRYGSFCSVWGGGGMGATLDGAGSAGTRIGAGGGTARAMILGGSTAGSRGGKSAVILGGSNAGMRDGEGALGGGWRFSRAACRTANVAAGGDGRTGGLDWVGPRSTMARRPTAVGSAVVGFSSSKSHVNDSAGVARRGLGGSEESWPAVRGWVPTALGSSGRAARAGRATMRSPVSAWVKPRDRLATYDSTLSGSSRSARRGRSTDTSSQ